MADALLEVTEQRVGKGDSDAGSLRIADRTNRADDAQRGGRGRHLQLVANVLAEGVEQRGGHRDLGGCSRGAPLNEGEQSFGHRVTDVELAEAGAGQPVGRADRYLTALVGDDPCAGRQQRARVGRW